MNNAEFNSLLVKRYRDNQNDPRVSNFAKVCEKISGPMSDEDILQSLQLAERLKPGFLKEFLGI